MLSLLLQFFNIRDKSRAECYGGENSLLQFTFEIMQQSLASKVKSCNKWFVSTKWLSLAPCSFIPSFFYPHLFTYTIVALFSSSPSRRHWRIRINIIIVEKGSSTPSLRASRRSVGRPEWRRVSTRILTTAIDSSTTCWW